MYNQYDTPFHSQILLYEVLKFNTPKNSSGWYLNMRHSRALIIKECCKISCRVNLSTYSLHSSHSSYAHIYVLIFVWQKIIARSSSLIIQELKDSVQEISKTTI